MRFPPPTVDRGLGTIEALHSRYKMEVQRAQRLEQEKLSTDMETADDTFEKMIGIVQRTIFFGSL